MTACTTHTAHVARAVCISEHGGPEVLGFRDVTVEDPGPCELLVEVAAAGLNRADCLQRRGFYPAPPGVVADVPGLEYAGVVKQVGRAVQTYRVGDRVMGIAAGGAMATLLTVAEREAMPIPKDMALTDAAAIPEVFLTAYDALFEQAHLRAGEVALLHAVASGIGTAALQLVNAAGAVSVGTSRSAKKLKRCKALGLDHAVLVEEGLFAEAVKQVASNGAHVVLDTVGAAYLKENVSALALRGRVVVIGLLGGAKGTLSLGALLAKRGTIIGSVLRSRAPEEKMQLAQTCIKNMLPGFKNKTLTPIVDAVMPMADVAAAHRRMDQNDTFGKIVLTW